MADYHAHEAFSKLIKHQKVLFAILCASRCIRIFDYNYKEGATELSEAITVALENYKVDCPDLNKIKRVKEALENAIPNLDEVGSQQTCAVQAGVSVLYALDAVISRADEDVIRAANSALEAVDGFTEYDGTGLEEERLWQNNILYEFQDTATAAEAITLMEQANRDHPQWETLWL